jgi:hypothetical protein
MHFVGGVFRAKPSSGAPLQSEHLISLQMGQKGRQLRATNRCPGPISISDVVDGEADARNGFVDVSAEHINPIESIQIMRRWGSASREHQRQEPRGSPERGPAASEEG